MKRNVTLITMSQGNVKALKKTFDSFWGIVDEIIYGDVLLFEDDRQIVESYKKDYNLKIVKYPFNFIYLNGFSAILNDMASHATNNLVIYMNCSEVIEIDNGITEIINSNPDKNTFFFDHATDPHRWYRAYDKTKLQWSGLIHEELVGDARPYHKPFFRMADEEKDMDNPNKAKLYNCIKECTYWKQLMEIVDHPEKIGATNEFWRNWAIDQYESMQHRLRKKGARVAAFAEGDLKKYFEEVANSDEFAAEKFQTTHAIEYQGDPQYLGKKPTT